MLGPPIRFYHLLDFLKRNDQGAAFDSLKRTIPRRQVDTRVRPGLKSRPALEYSYPKNIPAIDALIKLAMVPASMALTPNLAKSFLRSGTNAPMPPICIPMEPRFAKPHNAKVAMVKE